MHLGSRGGKVCKKTENESNDARILQDQKSTHQTTIGTSLECNSGPCFLVLLVFHFLRKLQLIIL